MKRAAAALATVIAITSLAGAVTLTGCGRKSADTGAAKGKPGVGQPGGSIPVQVATVTLSTIKDTIPVTGSLAALQDVELAAKATGRVISVAAREGDLVHAGQLLVQQDTTDLQANVREAQANVASAQAKVAQAITNYDIQVTQAKQAVQQARAAVAAAQQNYLKLQRGSRPQQVLQAQAQVAQAQANVNNAKTTLDRNKALFAAGAIAKADLDTAQTTYEVDVQLLKNAQASLSLTQAGYQSEDIAAAQEQVREQQANLRNQIANEKQVAVRKQDILAAQAGVAQAKATLAFNQQQVANAYIHSPIDGIVAARETEPGQIASPGTALMRIVNVRTVYYEPTVSETDFARIAVGDPVNVQVDALPGKTYTGKVTSVYPAASAANRVFSLRVTIDNPRNELRPGMFARGSIITHVARQVPVVPATALIPVASQAGFAANSSSDAQIANGTQIPPQQVVVVGPNNTAQLRPVKVGIQTMQEAQITGGLRAGEQIVVVGQQGLKTGDKLSIVNGTGGSVRTAQAKS